MSIRFLWLFPFWISFPVDAATLKVAVISDLNGNYGSAVYDQPVHEAVKKLTALKPDVVLATGDLVAGQSTKLSKKQVLDMWDGFHQAVTTPLETAGLPFAVTPGNHDASQYLPYSDERKEFVTQMGLHKPALIYVSEEFYPLRYAFVMGDALFISLDATIDLAMDQTQMLWLDKVLSENATFPVKIIYGHFPIVPFAQQREKDYLKNYVDIETLFKKHDVTLYLSGHHHAFYPGKRDKLRVVSSSCLGGGQRKLIGDSVTSPQSMLWIEIDSGKIQSLEALLYPNFVKQVQRTSLPKSIGSAPLEITRDDL